MNYYKILIKHEKITLDLALEMIKTISEKAYIRDFFYIDGGGLSLYTRGIRGIENLVKNYDFLNHDNTQIIDEFDYQYNALAKQGKIELKNFNITAKQLKELFKDDLEYGKKSLKKSNNKSVWGKNFYGWPALTLTS